MCHRHCSDILQPSSTPPHFLAIDYVVLMQAQEPLVHPLSLGEKRSLGGQQVVNSASRREARAPVQLPPAPVHPVAHGPRALLCPRPTGATRKPAPSRRAPPSSGAAVSFQIWGCCKRRLAAAAQPRSGPAAASKIRFAYTAPGGPLEHAGGALGLVTLHGSDR